MTRASKFENKTGFIHNSLFKSKKGIVESPTSASSAAVLILLITVVIVIYLLFLPPAEREKLLEGGDIPGTNSIGVNSHINLLGTSPLKEIPGKINYVKNTEIEHDLANFRIYTETDAQIITEVQSLYIKNSAFEKKYYEMPFKINQELSDNIYLSFNVFRPSGELNIYLNGVLIFDGELKEGSNTPLLLSKELLKQDNILYFKTSTPGFAFWRVHEYTLMNTRITGDITNKEHSYNMQTFYIEKSEMDNFEKATLEFFPECDKTEKNVIAIEINRNTVYNGIPDCGMINKISLSADKFYEGENTIDFSSEKGSYLIDSISVDVDLIKPDYPIYYFELSDDLFTTTTDNNKYCGKIDGICPSGCEDYEDKDCCFADSRSNYWCDLRTTNPRDRCVNSVLAEYTDRCPSVYEDINGNPHETMEYRCGDDTDGICPKECDQSTRKYLDKDCCFAENENNYWCSDLPLTGYESICTAVVTQSDCDACPNKYYNVDKETPNCKATTSTEDGEEELKSDVDVIMKVYFTDDSYKKIDFIVNGMTVPVDTYYTSYQRTINEQIRSGTNSIQIKPRSDVNIAQLKVSVE
ncbi:MAG: hypothetical protein AB7V77_03220 [Candidatus Woesearchaeota archaeon]